MRGMWARSWQRQTGRPTYALDAVLVESVRISGKPRQKFVAHLTHIPEPLMSMALHRGIFWEEVNARFDELKLDETVRAKVTGKLLETIPFCDEAKQCLEQRKRAWLERLSRQA